MLAIGNVRQCVGSGAEILIRIGEVDLGANERDLRRRGTPAFTNSRIEDRRFEPRVCADNQNRIGLLDAFNAGIEEIAGAAELRIELVSRLPAIERCRAEARQQIFQREHFFGAGKVARDGADLLSRSRFELGGDEVQSLVPACRLEASILLYIGLIEPLRFETVRNVAGLIGDPFLVYGVVVARKDAHDGRAAHVGADRGAHRIHDVDRLDRFHFPRPGTEGPRPVRQRTNGAKVDGVGAHFGENAAFEIGGDLGVLATADQTKLFDARDFGHVADAARTMDATRHHRLDEGADVLFFDGALVFLIARAAHAEGHRLVLQVAFAALIADRAVERMIDEQKLHHPFARLLDHWRRGRDDLWRAVLVRRQIVDEHRARRDRLRRTLHLDETHAAVAGDRKALVIAEAGNDRARHFAGVHQRRAVFDLNLLAVDNQLLWHRLFSAAYSAAMRACFA